MSRLKRNDWLPWLLAAYVFFLPFTRFFFLPYVSAKIQPTELIFLGLFPVALSHFRARLFQVAKPLALALTGYVLVNVGSALLASHYAAILEAAGRIYLVVIMLVVAAYIRERGEVGLHQLLRAWYFGALSMALLTYGGYLAYGVGQTTPVVQVYHNYPYFGTALRASGLTGGPNMLMVVLLLPALYAWQRWRRGSWNIWWFLALFVVMALSLSKEILLMLLGCWLLYPTGNAKLNTNRNRLVVLAVALVFWLGTHLILQERQPVEDSSLAGTEYTSERVIWESDQFQLLETSYLALKRAGISIAGQYPVLGTGPGQFNQYLPAEKEKGIYPEHLPNYDPHSTWIGAAAETGWLGLVSLVALFIVFYPYCRHLTTTATGPIVIYLLLLLIASVSVDAMNFRHLWVPLGMLLGWSTMSSRGM